jgi:hypothetical protein
MILKNDVKNKRVKKKLKDQELNEEEKVVF